MNYPLKFNKEEDYFMSTQSMLQSIKDYSFIAFQGTKDPRLNDKRVSEKTIFYSKQHKKHSC